MMCFSLILALLSCSSTQSGEPRLRSQVVSEHEELESELEPILAEPPERGGDRIACGRSHSCAIEAGHVLCWGDGDGAPQQEESLEDIVGLSAFGAQTCALDVEGTVYCWFRGNTSQLELDGLPAAPHRVEPMGEALRISAGGRHACALLTDQTIWCWGHNRAGQLGNEPEQAPENRLASLPPMRVVGIDDAVHVAVGAYSSCAIVSDGQVLCWGSNSSGQLGNSTVREGRVVPIPVVGLSDAIHLSLGDRYGCALRRDGTAWCWGENLPSAEGSPHESARPMQSCGVSDATQIDSGRHACALRRDGSVQCWGWGVIGAGSNNDCDDLGQVVGLPSLSELSLGGAHACARAESGEVWCWGEDRHGQLGRSPGTPPIPINPIPELEEVVQIVSGDHFMCARSEAGQVLCWGRPLACSRRPGSGQEFGELYELTEASPSVDIVASGSSVCALRRDGRVLCFRANTSHYEPPCGLPFASGVELEALRGALQIELSGFGALALRPGGQILWSPFRIEEGEVGVLRVAHVRDAVEIVGHNSGGCLRRRGGQVSCWSMQLRAPAVPEQLHEVTGVTDATAIVATRHGAIVIIHRDERVSRWLGRSWERSEGELQTDEALEGASDYSAGSGHGCALLRSGQVLCSGRNREGQVGNPPSDRVETPTIVQGLLDVIGISVGEDYSCAARQQGDVVCWGSNDAQLLGLHFVRPGNRPAPVQGLQITGDPE